MPNFPTNPVSRLPWLLGMLLTCAGCGSDVQLAGVSGKVLLDGQPLQFGSVMFQPEAGQPATAVIEPDGSFTLSTPAAGRGAPLGRNQVRVTCYEAQNPAAKRDEIGEGMGRSLIPERYTSYDTSGLIVDIPPNGITDLVLELTSH